MSSRIRNVLWQAKLPVVLGVGVLTLVVATLRANDERSCRQLCVKHRFVDGVYVRNAQGGCRCVTADGARVPAPLPDAR